MAIDRSMECSWKAIDMHKYQRIAMDSDGHQKIILDIHAHPWISTDLYADRCVPPKTDEYAWTPTLSLDMFRHVPMSTDSQSILEIVLAPVFKKNVCLFEEDLSSNLEASVTLWRPIGAISRPPWNYFGSDWSRLGTN